MTNTHIDKEAREEIGWVIERHLNSELLYWTGRFIDATGFSSDNADAIRFARKQDADVVLGRLLDGNGKVSEHMWVGPIPHDWFDSGMLNGAMSCRKCGIVQRRDGGNKPCKGEVRVGPRSQSPLPAEGESSPKAEAGEQRCCDCCSVLRQIGCNPSDLWCGVCNNYKAPLREAQPAEPKVVPQPSEQAKAAEWLPSGMMKPSEYEDPRRGDIAIRDTQWRSFIESERAQHKAEMEAVKKGARP